MKRSEVDESNLQLREAWKLYAHLNPGGESFDRDGLSLANANQPWFFMNVGMLSRPVADESDLKRRAMEATEYFSQAKNPWVLTASEDWFGVDPQGVLSSVGLEHKLDLTGMVAERLNPPARAFPLATRLLRTDNEEVSLALADLNAAAYGVPNRWGRLALCAVLRRAPLFGTVAYLGGRAASGALALPIENSLYVGWVATAKSYRRMSLAELVMRHFLEEARSATGLERTWLHATADGLPVYLRMGYRAVVKFPFYGPK